MPVTYRTGSQWYTDSPTFARYTTYREEDMYPDVRLYAERSQEQRPVNVNAGNKKVGAANLSVCYIRDITSIPGRVPPIPFTFAPFFAPNEYRPSVGFRFPQREHAVLTVLTDKREPMCGRVFTLTAGPYYAMLRPVIDYADSPDWWFLCRLIPEKGEEFCIRGSFLRREWAFRLPRPTERPLNTLARKERAFTPTKQEK